MFESIVLIIYILANIYFPIIGKIPVDCCINISLIILLYFKNGKKLNFNKRYMYIILFISLFISINGFLNMSIYYFYQLIRNLSFIINTYIIFNKIKISKIFKFIYCGLWINNIIIFMQLINISFIDNLLLKIQNIFNISNRMDYRANGIADGPLKAGSITLILFFYTLYYIKNIRIKVILATILMFYSLIQSRTSTMLIGIVFFIYLVENLRSIINIKRIITTVVAIIIISITTNLMFSFMEKNFTYFSNTLKWQTKEIFNIKESKTIEILTSDGVREINKFYSKQNIILNLFGNGKTNWDGADSIHSDNGYVTQIIGLGMFGAIILVLIYLYLLYEFIKVKPLRYRFISIFIILFLMNFKSTSFTAYHYFNLFFISYFNIRYMYIHDYNLNKINIS